MDHQQGLGHRRVDKLDDEVVKLYRTAIKDFLGDSDGDLLELHKKAMAKEKAGGGKPDLRPAGKRIADMYARKLDESLERMGIDKVDAYFLHGVEIPWVWQCTELWDAYDKAHKAGKVAHFGFSTHKHQKEVIDAALEAGTSGPWKIDLVMAGVNPGKLRRFAAGAGGPQKARHRRHRHEDHRHQEPPRGRPGKEVREPPGRQEIQRVGAG